MKYISGIVSMFFLLMAIYYKFAVNINCPIPDIALYWGSFYFITIYIFLGIFGWLLIDKCQSSIHIFSLILFIIFQITNVFKEVIIIITKNYDLWINDWRTSFVFTLLCLIFNILIVCVGRK